MPAMEITTDTIGPVTVIGLTGQLDSRSAPAAQERILSLLPDSRPVLLDLTGVSYLSSAGLRTMLLVYRQARTVDSFIALVGLSAELRGVMAATGFLRFFVVADCVADALEIVRAAEPREEAT